MIEVHHLTKLFGEFPAVDDLTFSVAPGEVLGLVGPNGAGKTTTLRCLVGILPASRGRVRLGGHDLDRDPVKAKRLAAFIPDEPRLFDYLTVQEHLRFVGRLYGVDGVDGVDARASALLAELELSGRESSLPADLSRGMKQKLAIACGLIHDPRIILFDEPLTGLDPAAIRRMKEIMAARAAAGCAVVVSSHLLWLVEEICHRILVLRGGRKVVEGSMQDLAESLPAISQDASLEEIFLRVTDDSAGERGSQNGS
jgi:ABC-2 type transport system ATP-binding protein